MNILAVNPWIVDCAAYDFWLKPYGFLAILTYLKNKGANIDYIDCLDKKVSSDNFGRGKYPYETIKNPPACKSIPRQFKRYGITIEEFQKQLQGKNPDYILVTSSMTYWYLGVVEAIKILKDKFPETPIILGGTYATLCFEHAKKTVPCDYIFKNESLGELFSLLKVDADFKELFSTLPAYENFYSNIDYAVFRSSWGCPFECSFCAIKKLSFSFIRVEIQKIVDFILKYSQKGVKDFVLYDDAFLYEPAYAKELLTKINKLKLGLNFHTPNALHLRFLDKDIACLLKETGFINPHFGLETLDPKLQKLWGDKVNQKDLIKGVKLLKKGGFKKGSFSVYLLLGFPGQDLKSLKKDAQFLHSLGAKVSLAEFSPVPGTKIFEEYKELMSDPLLHNNSIFGFFQKEKIKEFWEIKNYVRNLNKGCV